MAETVLITGCSTGVGRAAAEEFLEHGWTVYATARNTEDIADLGERGCETAALDVTDQEQVQAVVERVIDEQGRIDCLVNNAGISQAGALEEVPTEALERQFDVNVFGPHRLIRAVLPHMRERGDGTIINVSSIAGRLAQPVMGPYTGSKHALEGMSDALRVEVAPFGIDVVLIEPGWARTEMPAKGEESLWEVADEDTPYMQLYENGILVKDLMVSDYVAGEVGEIAVAIRKAAEAADPDPRYVVLTNGKLNILQAYLPDRLRDWLFTKTFWGPLASLR